MDKTHVSIIWRYCSLLILGFLFFYTPIISNILLVLTIYPANLLVNIFYPAFVYSSFIVVSLIAIEIIPACLAVSAYFLLLSLNILTPMARKKRILTLIFSGIALLVFNILRIVVLILLRVNNSVYFESIHKFIWYFLSTVFVIAIWFISAYLFKIKNIPFYSDFKSLLANY